MKKKHRDLTVDGIKYGCIAFNYGDGATVYLNKKIIFRFDMEGNESVKPNHVATAIKKHFK